MITRNLVFTLILFLSSFAVAQGYLYRYTNSEGVRVLNSSIPSEYANQGYEILNQYGQVIEVVPPAPSKDELEQAQRRSEMLERYHIMKRRYPSLADIEGAKVRRLDNIDTNISILVANLKGLENTLRDLMSQAAQKEREMGNVPTYLIEQIGNTEEEITMSEKVLKKRQDEREKESQKFDEDIEAYKLGTQLEQENLFGTPSPQ